MTVVTSLANMALELSNLGQGGEVWGPRAAGKLPLLALHTY